MTPTEIAAKAITEEFNSLLEILLEKNAAYGNSAFEPVRVFSKCEPDEQINVRLDDKMSRLMRGHNAGEDVELDLVGYIVLKRAYSRYKQIKKDEELKAALS